MKIDRDVINTIHYLWWKVSIDFNEHRDWLFCPDDTPHDAAQCLADDGQKLDESLREFVLAVDAQMDDLQNKDFVFGYPFSEEPRRPGDERPCFVANPYSNFAKLADIQQTIIDAGYAQNFKCTVSKDLGTAGDIVGQIWDGIRRAEVVVADLTGNNPNVFYEVGLAHALRKDTIFLTQDISTLPFDVRTSRCIVYDTDKLDDLRGDLEKAFAAVRRRYRFDPKPV